MLSLQEISDRLEIEQLFTDYSHAIDRRDWDALDSVFTEDAVIDYSEMGGAQGTLPEIKAYLNRALAQFSGFQHLVATSKITLRGDHAEARTICFNPMLLGRKEAEPHVFFCGLWYRDTLIRTPMGWRIQTRYEEKSYVYNVPTSFAPAPLDAGE